MSNLAKRHRRVSVFLIFAAFTLGSVLAIPTCSVSVNFDPIEFLTAPFVSSSESPS